MTEFDALAELTRIRERPRSPKKRLRKSGLDKYKGELLKMLGKDGTITELKMWLADRKVQVAWSTVKRWVDKNG
jgi:hypothetical protein